MAILLLDYITLHHQQTLLVVTLTINFVFFFRRARSRQIYRQHLLAIQAERIQKVSDRIVGIFYTMFNIEFLCKLSLSNQP